MSKKKIKGTITYQDLEGGFWGIIDEAGNKWQPVNFPNQLKHPEAKVEVEIEILDDVATSTMWGDPVQILSFHTLSPS